MQTSRPLIFQQKPPPNATKKRYVLAHDVCRAARKRTPFPPRRHFIPPLTLHLQQQSLPSPQSNPEAKRGISKRRQKLRAQNRTKSRSKSSSRSLQAGTPLRENECSENIDSDLKDIERTLDAVEERMTQTLNSLRTSMAMCADHMVETMSAIIATGADNVRSNITQVQTVRQGNRSTKGQLRALGQIDHE